MDDNVGLFIYRTYPEVAAKIGPALKARRDIMRQRHTTEFINNYGIKLAQTALDGLEESNSEPAFPTKVTNDREAKDEEEADIDYHTQDSTTSPSGLPPRSQAAPAEIWGSKTEPGPPSEPEPKTRDRTGEPEPRKEPGPGTQSKPEPETEPAPGEPEPESKTGQESETEPGPGRQLVPERKENQGQAHILSQNQGQRGNQNQN